MIKYIDQVEFKSQGDISVRTVERSIDFTKTAQFNDLTDDLKYYINHLKPKSGYGYLLISALSDENWGPNNNADYFPTESLNNPTDDFGYKTYPKFGKWYRLHKNKDPKASYGSVIASFWNSQMHRVEVIVEYNKAIDDWTETALKEGRNIEVSMGLKINYDVCPVCHPNWRQLYKIPEPQMVIISKSTDLNEIHRIGEENGVDLSYITEINDEGGAKGISRNANTYCDHIKYNKRRIMPGGQRVYMVNMRPVFFDISYVRTNADKAAFVLDKIASDGSSERITDDMLNDVLLKSSELSKKHAEIKDAEMEKRVPSQVLSDDDEEIQEYMKDNILPVLRNTEERLPNELLDDISDKYGIEEILSSFMGLGMFPKPREFQRIILINMGNKREADEYERKNMFITDELADRMLPEMTDSRLDISPSRLNFDLIDKLIPYVNRKSYFSKPVCQRITIIKKAGLDASLDPSNGAKSPLPSMLLAAAGYLGIAKASGKDITPILKQVMKQRYKILAGLIGATLVNEIVNSSNKEWSENVAFNRSKHAEQEKIAAVSLKSLLLIPAITLPTYIASENERQKAMQGYQTNAAQRLLIKNPGKISLTAMALAHKGTRNMIGSLAKKLFKGASYTMGSEIGFDGLNINDYPPSKHAEVIAGIWDAMEAYGNK